MVAGKNNPNALVRATSNPRLPPLPKLRVKRPNKQGENACVAFMSNVLSCWASHGYTTEGCAALEQQLRTCMDARKFEDVKKSRINHTLSRLYPQIRGPYKRK